MIVRRAFQYRLCPTRVQEATMQGILDRCVAKAHRQIRYQRRDFHHKAARMLVARYGLVVVEALQMANLMRRPAAQPATTEDGQIVYLPNGASTKAGLNKSINDAGWSQFIAILTYKAAEAGTVVVCVNPAGTSQTCSGCGVRVSKPLSERWHHCEQCGCSLQRDVNAARNLLALGQSVQARNPLGDA